MSARHRLDSGFTLIEIIVVVAVFSIMAAMAYGGLSAVLKTRAAIEVSLDRAAEYQRAYLRLRNDLQNLRNRPARDAFGDLQPALRTEGEKEVTLTRGGWRNPLSRPHSSLERVRYRLEEDRLVRESWRVLDFAQDSKPVTLTLLEGVNEIEWRFMPDGGSTQARSDWETSWPQDIGDRDSAMESPPPRALQLTLRTRDWGELTFLFSSDVDTSDIDFGEVGNDVGPGNGGGDDVDDGTDVDPGDGDSDGDDGGSDGSGDDGGAVIDDGSGVDDGSGGDEVQ